jgi:hypothetical protein
MKYDDFDTVDDDFDEDDYSFEEFEDGSLVKEWASVINAFVKNEQCCERRRFFVGSWLNLAKKRLSNDDFAGVVKQLGLSMCKAEEHMKYGCDLEQTLQYLRRTNTPTPRASQTLIPKEEQMTTFWLTFNDLNAPSNERFLGVAIFDMDESEGELPTGEIVRRAWELGINPGGSVRVSAVGPIPDQYKNQLITDDALLMRLGSKGRKQVN